MLVSEAIQQARARTGQSVDSSYLYYDNEDLLLRWLSELDGRIAYDLYRCKSWHPYIHTSVSGEEVDDNTKTLAIIFPWDTLYPVYLEAMIYFANGEYERYANAQAIYQEQISTYRKAVQRSRAIDGTPTIPIGGTGTGGSGTEITMWEDPS